MIRLTKEADYAIMLVGHISAYPQGQVHTAREISALSGLPLPMVSKILGSLARSEILTGHRGVGGGYSLENDPSEVSVAEVIRAIDGPISMVQCGAEPGACDHEPVCPTRINWARINRQIEAALEQVPISEMLVRRDTQELLEVQQATDTGPSNTEHEG
jgi:FeS assembly SUF system regulator